MACEQVLRTLSCQAFEFDLCGQERFSGVDWQLTDILRDDVAVVRQDGSLMRAAIGCAVGSEDDRLIEVMAADGTTGRLRTGMRIAGETGEVTVEASTIR